MTATDFRALPEGPPYHQLIDGYLVEDEGPIFRHQEVLTQILVGLANWVDRTQAGKVVPAPMDVYLSDHDVLKPDILFISSARLSIIASYVEAAPDLVVEISSPSTAKIDLGQKRFIYARSGVKEMWWVEPLRGTIDVYRLAADPHAPVATLGATDVLRTPLLPGFQLALRKLFTT